MAKKHKRKLSILVLALTLSLFLALAIPTIQANPDEKYEYYSPPAANTYSVFDGANWKGQTFTPSTHHTITLVSLKFHRVGSPGTVTVSIRATSGGLPTGLDLCSGTMDGNTITTSTSGAWYNITFSSHAPLQEGVQYGIVCRAPSGDGSNRVWWHAYQTGTYSGGTEVVSSDSGSSWSSVSGVDCLFEEWGTSDYQYYFHGVYDEDSGCLKPASDRAINATVYFTDGTAPETFEVNGTEIKGWSSQPQHFLFNLTTDREYWLSPNQDGIDIYIFDDTLTTYTISFLDLAGVLDDYPYVQAKRYINGTLYTVEKRKVDVEKKVTISLVTGCKYRLIIGNDVTYTYGDYLTTSATSVTLTLKGVEFPKETLLTYKYVRVYGSRKLGDPNGNITITYQDTLNETNEVEIFINYKNGTNAYNATETSNSFVHTWTSAQNNTDYAVVVNIDHAKYGTFTWKQYFPRGMSEAPWGMDWLGTSLPFNTNLIIPAILIVFAAGCFSVLNAEVGAFMAVVAALILTYMGWIPIPASILVVAFALAILMALEYAKRRVAT